MKTFALFCHCSFLLSITPSNIRLSGIKLLAAEARARAGSFPPAAPLVSQTRGSHERRKLFCDRRLLALINVVQTPGLPNLVIIRIDANSVQILWPNTGSYTLQQTANLATGSGCWATSGYSISTASGTNSITITPPTGNLFFRLKQ